MNITYRLAKVFLAILIVVLVGSLGYYALFGGKETFMDCLYMTVISITSVGFGEVIEITGNIPAEIFTMLLITFGMGIILYGISTLTALLIEGEISGILRKNKMRKQIKKLKNHLLVLGSKQEKGEIEFNPPAAQVLSSGLTLIVMGDVSDIASARKAF